MESIQIGILLYYNKHKEHDDTDGLIKNTDG
jgi:hypothetical protein